jgi:hypothetical protein
MNELLCPKSHVWIQADEEEQVVKLVVPTVARMPLVMGLNFPKESALVILPHGLWGPLYLLGERYLFGKVLLHGALLDEVAEEVPQVLHVLSPRGIGQGVAGDSFVEPVGDMTGPKTVDVLILSHMILEQAEHLPVGPLGVRTEVTATLQIGVDGLSQRGEIFVGSRLPAEEFMLAAMPPGIVIPKGVCIFSAGQESLRSSLLAGLQRDAFANRGAVSVVELDVVATALIGQERPF